jgi:hypothetical protein
LFRRAALDKIGVFDERFSTTSYALYDQAAALMNGGYKLLKRNLAGLVMPPYDSIPDLQTDKKEFKEKWGFDPD